MNRRFFSSWSTRKSWSVAVAGLVVALGAIVLLQADTRAEQPRPALPAGLTGPLGLVGAGGGAPRLSFDEPGLSGTVALTQGAVLYGGITRVFADLRLAADDVQGATIRRPVALAVVLDVSGSMEGQKIEEARRAVAQLLGQMRDDDQVAVILYSDAPLVLQPLARVGSVRQGLMARVGTIAAGGGTNIPAGLRLGAGALATVSGEFVRRVVLVSDGLDHSGVPIDSVAGEVRHRADQGATLSSLGVGTDYDERFLSSVADAGRGNYEFLADSDQLASFLRRELEQASTTMVTNLVADLELPAGWTVAQVYGAELGPALSGRHAVLIPVGALSAGEQRRVLVALDVRGGEPGGREAMAVRIRYDRPQVATVYDRPVGHLALVTVTDERALAASRDVEIHADAMTTIIDARQEQAVALWRRGQADQAAALSAQNAQEMEALNHLAYSPHRAERIGEYQRDSSNFQAQSASSEGGRAYGLRSNQARRVRARSW